MASSPIFPLPLTCKLIWLIWCYTFGYDYIRARHDPIRQELQVFTARNGRVA